MKRRNALKTLSLGAGYTMTGAGFAAFISGCKQDGSISDVGVDWSPSFMSMTETSLIENILDAFLPTTESSPGAKELKIVQVVDNVVNKLYKAEEQSAFKKGLGQLVSRFKSEFSVEADNIEQSHIDAFMEKYMGANESEEREKLNNLTWKEQEDLKPNEMDDHYFGKLLHTIRQQGISAYFSNETIATEHLSYDPIPGVYQGCIPLSEVGNSWSL